MKKSAQLVITREQFAALAKPLVGLQVTRPWRDYASAVFLELGPLMKIPSYRGSTGKTISPRPCGKACVMLQWDWRVERPRAVDFGPGSSYRRIDNRIPGLKGTCVVEVKVVGRLPELLIALSDNRLIHTFQITESPPGWVVFLPDGSWLTVERGRLVHGTQSLLSGCEHRGLHEIAARPKRFTRARRGERMKEKGKK